MEATVVRVAVVLLVGLQVQQVKVLMVVVLTAVVAVVHQPLVLTQRLI